MRRASSTLASGVVLAPLASSMASRIVSLAFQPG